MAFGIPETATLTIEGAPEKKGTLNISGPIVSSGNPPLFMAAPPHGKMPLWIGSRSATGSETLYVDGLVGGGASDYQGYAYLAIKATEGYYNKSDAPLHIESYLIGSGINVGPLVLTGDVLPTVSKNATIAVSGGISSAGGSVTDKLALIIESRDVQSRGMKWHIEKDFNTANTATLYINHRMGSGHLLLNMEGVNLDKDNITLFITPPASGNMNLYTRGFEE